MLRVRHKVLDLLDTFFDIRSQKKSFKISNTAIILVAPMELAAYLYDAWAYEQAKQESPDSNLPNSDQVDIQPCHDKDLRWNAPVIKWRTYVLSAIAVTTFNGLGLNQAIAASQLLEPSVNTAPWCNNVYLCNTSYVLEVQRLLAQRGFDVGEIDGVYGRYTKQAVIDFQRTQTNLVVDGIPGQQTLALLRNSPQIFFQNGTNQTNPPSNSSDRWRQTVTVRPSQPMNMQTIQSVDIQRSLGEEVGNLQILLKQRGFYEGEIDGQQGKSTTDAILKAQRAYGLPLDGFAGPVTIRSLLAGGQNMAFSQSAIAASPSSQDVWDTQLLLKERGFYEAEVDGVYSLRTRASILKAQLAYGQTSTGDWSPELMAFLKAQTNLPINARTVPNQNQTNQNLLSSPNYTQPNRPTNQDTGLQANSNSQSPISRQNLPAKASNSS